MSKLDLKSLDDGKLRHPLYGNRNYWYEQRVTPGFWTKAMEETVEEVRTQMLKVIDDVVAEMAHGPKAPTP